jgi:hypothetical protein
MTNWQDKYKDLKVGESAWYWHKSSLGTDAAVLVSPCIKGFCSNTGYPITESYPNGPRCMTPEEIEKLLSPKEEVELPSAEVYQELEDSIVGKKENLLEDTWAWKEIHEAEEICNIYKNEPLFPGDSISHKTLNACVSKNWAVRDASGFVHTTKKGREHYHSLCLERIMNTTKFLDPHEYKNLEDEIVESKAPTPMPAWLEKQLDVVSDIVSQWSEEKKKDFLGLTEENRKEIFEFAMKRSDEILRGKKDSVVEEPYVLGSCGRGGCRGFTTRLDQGYCSNCKAALMGSVERSLRKMGLMKKVEE